VPPPAPRTQIWPQIEAAVHHYRVAANRTTSTPERNYLMMQAARLAEI